MNTNLMCSSGKEIDFQKSIFSVNNSLIVEFCFCEFWIHWVDGSHPFSISWITTNKGFNISFFIFYDTIHESQICFMYCSLCDLELESMHGFIIFCDDDESTCILIKTMNDARALNTIDDGWIEFWIFTSYSESFEVMKKSIYEGSFSPTFSGCWMRIDTSIFINDSKIIVLKHNIKRHIFSNKFHRFDDPMNFYNISFIDFFIFGKILTIGFDFSFFDHLLDITTRLFWKKSR